MALLKISPGAWLDTSSPIAENLHVIPLLSTQPCLSLAVADPRGLPPGQVSSLQHPGRSPRGKEACVQGLQGGPLLSCRNEGQWRNKRQVGCVSQKHLTAPDLAVPQGGNVNHCQSQTWRLSWVEPLCITANLCLIFPESSKAASMIP